MWLFAAVISEQLNLSCAWGELKGGISEQPWGQMWAPRCLLFPSTLHTAPVTAPESRAHADLPWPRRGRLAAALHKAHIYKHIHSESSLSPPLQRKPSVQNLGYTLFWCIDRTPPFTVKQFWMIRKMNEHAAFWESRVYTGQKIPDRTSLFSALTILSEISCLSTNWAATAEDVFVYFSKLCFSNINVKKLRIRGFKTREFYSTCSLLWFLNSGSLWTHNTAAMERNNGCYYEMTAALHYTDIQYKKKDIVPLSFFSLLSFFSYITVIQK